jgi:hypothetical protein
MARDSRGIDYAFRPWRGAPRTRSLWIEEALAKESGDAPLSLEGEIKADVCIVGGGFAGLWTAIRLREFDATARIVILEPISAVRAPAAATAVVPGTGGPRRRRC